jgi:hypothetical protein
MTSPRTRLPILLSFLLLPLLLFRASPLAAQVIDGVVREEEGRTPVARAMIVLLDSAGAPLGQTRSGADGRFTVYAPGPGTYRVRAERVGRAATVSEPLALAMGETKALELIARREAVQLEAIVAEAGESQCTLRRDSTGRVATVWEEARKALSSAEWARANQPRDFVVRRHVREMDPASLLIRKEQAESGVTRQVTPFRSLPAEQLAERGYVVRDGGSFIYYAPDAEVLLSDAFLDTHCFSLARDERKRPGQLGLAFEPARGRRLADVRGVLWLDQATAELREVEYEYTRVDADPGRGSARRDGLAWGGKIEFGRAPEGEWYVRRWHIRMPVSGSRAPDGGGLRAQVDLGLVAVKEEGAEVTQVRNVAGRVVVAARAGGGAVRGMVWDSTRSAGLAGATVFLVGTEHATQADSTGAFQLENVPEGRYGVAYVHPRADSLFYIPEPVEVELAAGREDTVRLSLGRPSRVAAAAAGQAIELAPVRAVSTQGQRRLQLTGFVDRQRMRGGAFLTGEQFAARPGARAIDRLQGLRGTYARPTQGDPSSGGSTMTWMFYQYNFGRRCVASVWLEGMYVHVRDMDTIGRLNADDVLAVEVYSPTEVPRQFVAPHTDTGQPTCGAVVIWLKRPTIS